MIDWAKIGDKVFSILEFFKENQGRMKVQAKARGISMNQLAAASITGMIREALKDGDPTNAVEPPSLN